MRPAIEKTSSLDTHLSDVAGLRLRQRLPERRHERQEVREAVRARTEDHHGDTGARDVLLESEVAIHRDKRRESFRTHQPEEDAVPPTRPSLARDVGDIDPGQLTPEPTGHALIEQYTQLGGS